MMKKSPHVIFDEPTEEIKEEDSSNNTGKAVQKLKEMSLIRKGKQTDTSGLEKSTRNLSMKTFN